MMKKLALILGMLAVAAGSLFAEAKNAVVLDMNQVLASFSKTIAVKEEVEADGKFAETTQQSNIDKFNKQREELAKAVENLKATKNNPTLSKAAVTKAEAEVEKLYTEVAKAEQELRKNQQEMREFLQKKFAEKTNVILKEDILPRIKELAKKHNAEIVLNRANVFYVEESADITQELIDLLNKAFPAPKKD
ncbi:MAG: OmpH family outer membrane protein [Opitutales bacterium]|nr:OmpH family outer membrane protein [Opitutales bacterium]